MEDTSQIGISSNSLVTRKPQSDDRGLNFLGKSGLAVDPTRNRLRTQPRQIQLIFLLIAVEVIGKFPRLFKLFKLIDGGVTQLLQRLHPLSWHPNSCAFFLRTEDWGATSGRICGKHEMTDRYIACSDCAALELEEGLVQTWDKIYLFLIEILMKSLH